jgi:DNA repair protein SbcD/Mre11
MKILHTSDLHIGKRLHQVDLMEDQAAFFVWLINLVEKESIDALLISGDIFDVANPSSESRKLYYELLVQLSRLRCKVIITGGNHDSPAVLEAPRELLKAIDIHVVGGHAENLEQMLVEIPDKDGKPAVIIAAIPFLRDRDLRRMNESETYEDRLDAVKSGIIKTYSDAAALCLRKYPGIPAIAMGHLFLMNAKISDSEREVQIGNLAGIEGSRLPDYFSYLALGHLHKPQDMDSSGRIRYSGTPYPLSFSEKDNANRVILINVEDGKLHSESIEIPANRRLIKYSGTLEEVKRMLSSFESNNSSFTSLIELDVLEESYDPGLVSELELIPDTFKLENALIVKSRIQFKNKVSGTNELYSIDKNIDELAPKDIFLKRIEAEALSEESKALLIEAFEEIYQLIHEQE